MKSSKHIVLVTPGFPSDETDDTCIPPLQLYVRKLQEFSGYRISIVSLQYPHHTTPYQWHGMSVYPCFRGHSKVEKVFKWKFAIRVLKRLHKEQSIDLIHAFWLTEATFLAQRFIKTIPVVATMMGQDAKSSNKYLPFLKLKKLSIVGVSEFQQTLFLNKYPQLRTKVISWGIDPGTIELGRERSIDFLGVGSLIPLKNFRLFVEVINALKEKYPSIRAEIIGEGPEYENLKEVIVENQLPIVLNGKLSRDEVRQKMSHSKILLHPSIYESQGYVFYEALQSGMYVVSQHVGVAKPSIRWMTADNLESFCKAVDGLIQQPMNFEPIEVTTMSDTVEAYSNLYRELGC